MSLAKRDTSFNNVHFGRCGVWRRDSRRSQEGTATNAAHHHDLIAAHFDASRRARCVPVRGPARRRPKFRLPLRRSGRPGYAALRHMSSLVPSRMPRLGRSRYPVPRVRLPGLRCCCGSKQATSDHHGYDTSIRVSRTSCICALAPREPSTCARINPCGTCHCASCGRHGAWRCWDCGSGGARHTAALGDEEGVFRQGSS